MAAGQKFSTLVLLVVMATTLVPSEAFSKDEGQVAADACCGSGTKYPAHPAQEIPGAPFADGCCTDGCHSCFMRCCAGQVAAQISAVVLDPNLPSLKSVAPLQDSFSFTESDEIYHPPRF